MALASFVGIGIYRLHRGIHEENAAIADFNSDGKEDMIYLNHVGPGHYATMFVDGKHVKMLWASR